MSNYIAADNDFDADGNHLQDPDSEPQSPAVVDGKMMDIGFGTRLMWAPWDGRKNLNGTSISPALFSTETLVALVLEFAFSLVLGLAVVSARAYTLLGAGSNGLQDGLFIAIIYASVWLFSWNWERDYNLKRHLNWAITIGYLFKFRPPVNGKSVQGPDYGLLAFILYGGAQLGGAAVAGAWLAAFGLGNLPNPSAAAFGGAVTAAQAPPALLGATLDTVSPGLIWFLEFFAVFLIVLANIYNDERHQDKNNNGGDARENEYDNHTRTGFITALVLFVVVTFSYPLGSYSLGNVPYFAGLVAVGPETAAAANVASNPGSTRLIDWAHYLGTPLAAGVAGGLFAFFVSYIKSIKNKAPINTYGFQIMSRQRYRSVQTPLTQQLLAKNRPQTGLRARQPASQPLKVKAFA